MLENIGLCKITHMTRKTDTSWRHWHDKFVIQDWVSNIRDRRLINKQQNQAKGCFLTRFYLKLTIVHGLRSWSRPLTDQANTYLKLILYSGKFCAGTKFCWVATQAIFIVLLVLWQLIDLSMKSAKFYEDFPPYGSTKYHAVSPVYTLCMQSIKQSERVMQICQNRQCHHRCL